MEIQKEMYILTVFEMQSANRFMFCFQFNLNSAIISRSQMFYMHVCVSMYKMHKSL